MIIVAKSEIDSNKYFVFRKIRDGTYKELQVIITKDKLISSLSDKLRADEMEWFRKHVFKSNENS